MPGYMSGYTGHVRTQPAVAVASSSVRKDTGIVGYTGHSRKKPNVTASLKDNSRETVHIAGYTGHVPLQKMACVGQNLHDLTNPATAQRGNHPANGVLTDKTSLQATIRKRTSDDEFGRPTSYAGPPVVRDASGRISKEQMKQVNSNLGAEEKFRWSKYDNLGPNRIQVRQTDISADGKKPIVGYKGHLRGAMFDRPGSQYNQPDPRDPRSDLCPNPMPNYQGGKWKRVDHPVIGQSAYRPPPELRAAYTMGIVDSSNESPRNKFFRARTDIY